MKEESLKLFDKAVVEGKATWWQMDLPSGEVIFGQAKSDMLGYPSEKFMKFEDFTNLLHPDDYKKAMKAMKDHLQGKAQFYDTVYRIKDKKGKYLKFYDCGQIIKRAKDTITVMGFVWKVDEKQDISSQIEDIKKIVLENKPSMIDLVKKIK